MSGSGEDREWQRLDKWLWCARFMRARSDCARFVAGGLLRINRQATDKPHARVRVGDVLTVPSPHPTGGEMVRVVAVLALAARRGPAAEARLLYREIPPGGEASDAAAPQGPLRSDRNDGISPGLAVP